MHNKMNRNKRAEKRIIKNVYDFIVSFSLHFRNIHCHRVIFFFWPVDSIIFRICMCSMRRAVQFDYILFGMIVRESWIPSDLNTDRFFRFIFLSVLMTTIHVIDIDRRNIVFVAWCLFQSMVENHFRIQVILRFASFYSTFVPKSIALWNYRFILIRFVFLTPDFSTHTLQRFCVFSTKIDWKSFLAFIWFSFFALTHKK